MTTIIALMGPAGSGKSTAADYLVKKYDATRYSFAAPLKELAMRTLGFTREQVFGTQAQKEADDPRYGFSPRWFLQRLGTDGCRAVFGENFWVEQTIRKIRQEAPKLAVIEDCRFVNEAVAVRDFGDPRENGDRGMVWLLESPGCNTVSTDAGTHASEQEWKIAPADYRIRPPVRSIPLMHAAIDALMEHDAKLQALFAGSCQPGGIAERKAWTPQTGDRVRVVRCSEDYALQRIGVLTRIDSSDPDLPYLVQLADGGGYWCGQIAPE